MGGQVTVSQARDGFAELINRVAYARERVQVVRRGRPLAALVPMADVELLEALEDELDIAEATEALANPGNATAIPWDDVRAGLRE